jgi:hypothetical protein
MRFCRQHAELALLGVSSHPDRDCRGPTDAQGWPAAASALPGPLPPALPSIPLPRWHVRCAPVLCRASSRQPFRMCQLHLYNPPSPFQTQPLLHQPCPRSQPRTRAQIWNTPPPLTTPSPHHLTEPAHCITSSLHHHLTASPHCATSLHHLTKPATLLHHLIAPPHLPTPPPPPPPSPPPPPQPQPHNHCHTATEGGGGCMAVMW